MKRLMPVQPAHVLEELWERLHERGDPRATLPIGHRTFPRDEQKLRWVQMRLGGRRRTGFGLLAATELAYLHEFLACGRTRLDDALAAEFRAQKIGVPELWYEAHKSTVRHSHLAWNFGGRAYSEMNRLDKLHLLRALKSRG